MHSLNDRVNGREHRWALVFACVAGTLLSSQSATLAKESGAVTTIKTASVTTSRSEGSGTRGDSKTVAKNSSSAKPQTAEKSDKVVKATVGDKAEKTDKAVKPPAGAKAEITDNGKAKTKAKAANSTMKGSSRRVMLVPPPPPNIPTYIDGMPAGFMDGSVEILSLEDLKERKITTEKKLAGAKLDFKDQETYAAEAKDRAQRFESLFEEGVVSKKELIESRHDAEKAERDLETGKLTTGDIERVLTRITERIKTLEASKKAQTSQPKSRNKKSKGK